MSFSGSVKNELCQSPLGDACCARAEAYGALLHCNTFTPQEVRVITESESFARRLPALLDRAFGLAFDRLPAEGEHKYVFQITDREKTGRIVDAFGFDSRQSPVLHINFGLLEEEKPTLSKEHRGLTGVLGSAGQSFGLTEDGGGISREMRELAGVLYEIYLRRYEVTNNTYVFAQDVDITFIAKVKEQGLAGVRIVTAPMSSRRRASRATLVLSTA